MKLLLDIKDSKAAAFLKMLKEFTFVKTEAITASDAELLNEIKIIKKALEDAKLVEGGKIKTRPAQDLLNEL